MLRRLVGRDVRRAAASGDEAVLAEEALRILYQRKAFGEDTGTGEEHYPQRKPPPPPALRRPARSERPRPAGASVIRRHLAAAAA